MRQTYRRRLVWCLNSDINDGGADGRKSRSTNKPVARRIQRREHNRIIADGIRDFYANGADTLFDYMDIKDDFDDSMYELAREYEDESYRLEEEDHKSREDESYYFDDYYEDPYNDYMDRHEDTFYAEGSLSKQGFTRFEMNAHVVVRSEDVGRSLGDIIQEYLTRINGE